MGTHYKGLKSEERVLNTYIKLQRASESLNTMLARQLAEHDLTISQFGVLEILHHKGPHNQKSIAQKLLKTGGNITLVIENLSKRNYVERRRCTEDRRNIYIDLSDEGRALIEEVFPKHLAKVMSAFEGIDDDALQTLDDECKRIGMRAKSLSENCNEKS